MKIANAIYKWVIVVNMVAYFTFAAAVIIFHPARDAANRLASVSVVSWLLLFALSAVFILFDRRAAGRGFLVVLLGFALLFHYKERDCYRCQLCFSQKIIYQWRLGSWEGSGSGIPLTPTWEWLKESQFRHDFFAADHVHDWRLTQANPYYFFGTTARGCGVGPGRYFVSNIYETYEESPELRAFIQAKLHDGSLAKSNVMAMISEPDGPQDTPLNREADALLRTFGSR